MTDFTEVCSSCPCADTRLAPCRRTQKKKTAIVVDHPTALDQAKGTLLNGDSGMLVRKVLNHYGVKVSDCYVTTALNCRPNPKKQAMMNKASNGCRDRLVWELKEQGVERVLCLGAVPLTQLGGGDKVVPITKRRGRWERYHDMDVLGTFNPAWLFGESDYFRDFCFDIEKFCTTEPERTPPDLEMWFIQSVREAREAFEFLADASFVSFDVETTGISSYRDTLLAVGFGVLYEGTNDGVSIVLPSQILEARDVWAEIGRFLSNPHQASVAHNAKFDLKFLRKYLLEFGLPYDPQHIEDTMLLNYCLDERPMGRFGSHSLKNMSRVRCDAPDYDIEMGKWLKEYKVAEPDRRHEMILQMQEYLSLDCYYTARLYPGLLNEVVEEDPKLLSHYQNTLMPASLALVEIEMHGAAVDRAFFEEQWAELNKRAAPILQELREFLEEPEFNPNSPKQVAELLYNPPDKGGYGLPVLRTARRGKQQEGKTSKQILKMLKKKFPQDEELIWVIDQILAYRNLIKNAGTYVKGLLERMDDDGRIRSDFLPHGTSTGRISSSNPNLQNIPEASHTKIEIRNGYVVPPGYLLGNADYSQLELRVAAWLSGDENFTAAYVEDRDFHQEVVFALFGKTKEEATPYERYMAKCCTFGVLYGRGAPSLALGPEMDYVEDELGGNRWSVDDVKGFFADFFSNFPQYKQWTEDISKFAYENQYVQTPFGNKRRFPFIPRNDNGAVQRQAVNTPIQGTAALITLSAVTRIHKRFKELNEREGKHVAHVVLTVHDSIMFEFLPSYLDEVKAIVKYEMEDNIPFKDCPVPFKSDFEAAPRWGQVKDWNLAENLPAVLEMEEIEV